MDFFERAILWESSAQSTVIISTFRVMLNREGSRSLGHCSVSQGCHARPYALIYQMIDTHDWDVKGKEPL